MIKFLIVDDDRDDSELFIEALSCLQNKHQYFSACDGQEAIETLKEECIPDIIFLDINMPVMNGWECLTKLRAEEMYKNIPVIIYSTSSRTSDKMLAKDLGANCFVTKISDFKKLKKMLEIVAEQVNKQSADEICKAIYKNLSLN